MKTLDEVIKAFEICDETVTANCPDCPYDIDCENVPGEDLRTDALHYLKEYRSEKAMWEADRKGYLNWIEQYKEAREKHQQAVIELKKNPPLTWDDLLAIAGQPVWVECAEETHLKPFWGLVGRYTGHSIPFYTLAPIGEGCSIAYGHKNDMGINWIAYRKERI